MTDQADRTASLGADLHDTARSFDLPGGDLEAVLRRGRHRRHHRRRALAGMTAIALVAATVGAVRVLDDGEPEISVASVGGLTRGDVGIEWRTVSPSSGLGYANGSEAGSGATTPLYAISTAPGQAEVKEGPMPRVLWRSDDGVEWTALSTQVSDMFVAELATRDDRVYAVGTGPATAAGGGRAVSPLLVGWSDDGAETWERTTLPIDLAAMSSGTTRVGVRSATVASGRSGTVAAAVLFASLDVPALLPAGATAPNGWAITATGVDVLGPAREVVCPDGTTVPEKPSPAQAAAVRQKRALVAGEGDGAANEPGEVGPSWCLRGDGSPVEVTAQEVQGVSASYSWEQLHVDGDLLRAVRSQPVAFAAAPGSDRFERVDLPLVEPLQGGPLLDAGDSGFDLVLAPMKGGWSAKGTSMPSTDLLVLHSDDGRSWSPSGQADGAGTWASAVGRVGGVATIVGQNAETGVVLRADGAGGWTGTPLAGLVEGGVPEGGAVYLMGAAIGPFGIVAAVNVVPDKKGGTRPEEIDQRILVSRDGTTWEEHDAADLAGRPVANLIRVSVVGERAVVALSLPSSGTARSKQLVLVGTPT